ncbi:MAG: DapH/DapD/GlmU-related protein [Planctomycetales bacterium]
MAAWPKQRQFRKLAVMGRDVEVGFTAGCQARRAGQQITIGDHCSIWGTLICNEGGNISIGSHTTIRYHTIVGSAVDISIGNYCIISNHVHIYDHNSHPTDPADRMRMLETGFYGDAWDWKHSAKKPIVIEDNVWIGFGAVVLKGVRIGEGSIVAACAVVTRDIPSYSVAAGNPARVVKTLKPQETS